jgi:Tfp pilus assembly protein PilV
MRIPALAILAAVAVLTAGEAPAQTYGGNFPFCLQHFRWGGSDNIDCAYSTLAQCNATASGLAAICSANPYLARAQAPAAPRYRRQRGAY